MVFTHAEMNYLSSQPLARLATVGPGGGPQVKPLSFRVNDDGTLDIGGPGMEKSQKYRNAVARPQVSVLIDDMTPDEPGAIRSGWGRGVEIRGRAETLTVDVPPVAPQRFSHEIIRIHPERILSWHIDPENPDGESRNLT